MRGMSRAEAADAVGVARTLAAFHLGKLVDAGLLEVAHRRLTGRSGPGAGRPAKVGGDRFCRAEIGLGDGVRIT